jgi:protein gp37
MGDNTAIEWSDATWNPTAGCSLVSPGCTNCYAMRVAHRLARMPEQREFYAGMTQESKAGPVWTGSVRLIEKALDRPLRWKKPRRIFVNSMSDLFHEALPDGAIDKVFAVMALASQHTFQVLTKRAERMRAYSLGMAAAGDLGRFERYIARNPASFSRGLEWPLPNVWLGVSVEDQQRADERIPHLLATPAAVRFLSCEPLLGPVDLTKIAVPDAAAGKYAGHRYTFNALQREDDLKLFNAPAHVDWVIAGGESGRGARPMHPEWARALRDQCAAAGVAFHFKQWGEWALTTPEPGGDLGGDMRRDRVRFVQADRAPDGHFRRGDVIVRRVGKKSAGRLLDGREWNEMPER